jgi:hypothetical protein
MLPFKYLLASRLSERSVLLYHFLTTICTVGDLLISLLLKVTICVPVYKNY